MLQGLTRFLLDKIVHDAKAIKPVSSEMDQSDMDQVCGTFRPERFSY